MFASPLRQALDCFSGCQVEAAPAAGRELAIQGMLGQRVVEPVEIGADFTHEPDSSDLSERALDIGFSTLRGAYADPYEVFKGKRLTQHAGSIFKLDQV